MKLRKEVHVRFTEYTYERLLKFARARGITCACIVRLAVKDYLSKKGYFANHENY